MILGIDVGGTFIKSAVVQSDLAIVKTFRTPTPRFDSHSFAQFLAEEIIQPPRQTYRLDAIGLTLPGHVDPHSGTLLHPPNNLPQLGALPYAHVLQEMTGLPVVADNDATAAAFGEYAVRGRTPDPMVMITLGTGVGGGTVVEGKLFRGATNNASEIGHVPVLGNRRRCGCGAIGCIETLLNEKGLLLSARELGLDERLSIPELIEIARGGHPVACKFWSDAGEILGTFAAGLANILDPRLVVIGGGISHAGDLLLLPAQAAFGQHVLPASRDHVRMELAQTQNNAGMLGIVALALSAC